MFPHFSLLAKLTRQHVHSLLLSLCSQRCQESTIDRSRNINRAQQQTLVQIQVMMLMFLLLSLMFFQEPSLPLAYAK